VFRPAPKKIRKEIFKMEERLTNIEDMTQSKMDDSLKDWCSLHKINNITREIIESLKVIESLTEKINKILLPQDKKAQLAEKTEQPAPHGWFEIHLLDLKFAEFEVSKIINNLENLSRETKTDVK